MGPQFHYSQFAMWAGCSKSCVIYYDSSIFQKSYPCYLTPFVWVDISGEGIGLSYEGSRLMRYVLMSISNYLKKKKISTFLKCGQH